MTRIDRPTERERNILLQKHNIVSAWQLNNTEKDKRPNHLMCFDLSDDYARETLLMICNNVPGDVFAKLKETLSKPQKRTQPVFAREELFISICKTFYADFELKEGYFGVLYVGDGGHSLVWIDIPSATDGQHRRKM